MSRLKKYAVPKGLKRVKKKLASGEVRIHWYHRATGRALNNDPMTAAGLMEVDRLDKRAAALEATGERHARSYAAMWDEYVASPAFTDLKPRTQADYQKVRDWIGDRANAMLVAAVDETHAQKIQDSGVRAKGRRFGNYVVQVMRLTFEWGRMRGWTKTNPFMGVKLVQRAKGARHVNRAWADEEVIAFARSAPAHLLVPFALGLFASMREGDAVRIEWSGYDGSTLTWDAGKNGQTCTAPVTGVFKVILDGAKAIAGDCPKIAVNSYGKAWTESGFRSSFFGHIRNLYESGGIKLGCTFHGLRHTVGSTARNSGTSDSHIAAAIGDKTTAMAGVYARDADSRTAQMSVLGTIQDRFVGPEWKPEWKPSKKVKKQIAQTLTA